MPLAKDKFRERLAYYLMGVAIGCTLLGFAWIARQRSAQRAQQQHQQAQPATPAAPTAR